MRTLLIISLFAASQAAFSTTKQAAYDQCKSYAASDAATGTYHSECIDSPANSRWIRYKYLNSDNTLASTYSHLYTGTTPSCSGSNATYNFDSATCQCNSGYSGYPNCQLTNNCTAGQTGTVSVAFAKETESPNSLEIFVTGDGSGNHTYCSGGCIYSYNDSGYTGTGGKSSDNTISFMNYSGTKTGATCSTPTSTNISGTNQTPATSASVADPNCVTNSTGKKVCANTTGSGQFGYVSTPGKPSVEVCPQSTDNPNCQVIPGFADPVCSGAPKNCGWVNGQYICAEPDSGSARNPDNTTNCVENSQGRKCVTGNEGVATSTTSTTTSNPDGSTTTTKSTCNNVIGDDCTTSSTTTASGGGSSTTTDNGASQSEGDSLNLSDIAANTKRTADNTDTIASLTEQIEGLLDPSGAPNSITGNDTGLDAEMDAQTAALGLNLTDESSFLGTSLFDIPDSTDCQAIHQTAGGRTFDFDPCEKLAPMRDMLGWFFYVSVIYFAYQIAIRGNNR